MYKKKLKQKMSKRKKKKKIQKKERKKERKKEYFCIERLKQHRKWAFLKKRGLNETEKDLTETYIRIDLSINQMSSVSFKNFIWKICI